MTSPSQFKRQQGFAIVTSLLVLAVVGALAVGAFFLTSTNLRLAQNARAQAVAKYNAELWLDVALMTIADGYVALGRIPSLDELSPFLIQSGEYEVTRYWVNESGTTGEIQVTGLALRGDAGAAMARHPVSARFVGQTSSRSSPSGPGFITPQSINVSGASQLLINMHAGGSLNVSGNVDFGDPQIHGQFSFKSGTGQCSLGTAGQCEEGADPPIVEPVDWQGEYEAAIAQYCSSGPNVAPSSGGSTRTVSVSPAEAGRVICLPESGNYKITGGPLRNVTIVGGKDTVVTLEAGSELDPNSNSEPPDVGLRIIAGDILLTANNTLKDRNLVIAHGNVVLNRAVTQSQIQEVDEDGVLRNLVVVKSLIKAGNDVVFTGSGTSGTYAQVIANGKFCRSGNGGARFIGTIIAGAGTPNGTRLKGGSEVCNGDRAAIDFRGGGKWTASLPDRFDVGESDVEVPTGIVVTARRP